MTFEDDDFPDGWRGINTWTAVSETLHLTRTRRQDVDDPAWLAWKKSLKKIQDAKRSTTHGEHLRALWASQWAKTRSDPVALEHHRSLNRDSYWRRKQDAGWLARRRHNQKMRARAARAMVREARR